MTIEVSAKKVDDAIKQGLEQLGATLDDVKVEVVDAGGLFRKAKVRLTLETEAAQEQPEKKSVAHEEKHAPEEKPAHEEKPVHEEKPHAEKSHEEKPHAHEEKPHAHEEAKAPVKKPASQKAKSAGGQAKPDKPEKKVKNEQAPADGEEKSAKSQSDPSAQNEKSEPRQKSGADKKEKSKKTAHEDKTDDIEKSQAQDGEADREQGGDDLSARKGKRRLRAEDREAAAHALEFVKKTVELMGFESSSVSADEDIEHVEITAPEGDDSLIIGRHGETLSALTYLAETCARAEKCHVNIVVDCNGYRARRAASLTAMAKRRARESASKHRRIKLEPMDRTDRRTIHCALAEDEYVTTASEGKEPYRYVVITPKDGAVHDYDDSKRDRRDRRGKGRDRGRAADSAPTGEKPRRAAFDINIHGFVGHNDPTPDDDENPAE